MPPPRSDRGPSVLERHRTVLDKAVRLWDDDKLSPHERKWRRLVVRASAKHVALIENPYMADDKAFIHRVEGMSLRRVRTGVVEYCPRCHVGLVMAHGMCSRGHDPGRY